MKIALFSDTNRPQINGVTNTIGRFEDYMNENGIEYMIFSPRYSNESPVKDSLETFRSMKCPFYPEFRIALPLYSRLAKKADDFDPDIVHLMTPLGLGLTGMKYGKETGTVITSSFTTNFFSYLKYYKLEYLKKPLWKFTKWFHNECDATFCPSKDTLKLLEAQDIDRLKIWSRGIDTSFFSPEYRNEALRQELMRGSEILFLYTGRIAREKDLEILMKSAANIQCCYPGKAAFVVTGDGPHLDEIKRIAPGNVVFTGYKQGKDLAQIYASCDVFSFPSSTETFGNVVLEAMASGLPVAAVNSGGVKETVIHNHNGVLCKPRNVESYTEALKMFIDNKGIINSMGDAARAYAEERSWKKIFDRLVRDYQTLLSYSSIRSA